ncbi:peptidase M23 [Tenuifilaceae bacterium CYCD]|nr:peptidase M23 [Tenuifilaceae bacterium CYCD]
MKQIVVFLVAILAFSSVVAQETVVERSADKVKIDGKTYYIHIVKSGETLYAISNAYDISQSEIATNNPDIYAGIKVGQALKIPKKSDEVENDENYFYHIVKKKETLFGISRQYNVTVDDIIKLNPEVKDGLQQSQTIRIPKFKIEAHSEKPAADTLTFIIHEVQPKEGLFAISRKYGVDAKEIEFYNKELLADGVKLGTSLRIPIKPKIDSTGTVVPKEVVAFDSEKDDKAVTPCSTDYIYNGAAFNIALFLPFTQVEAGDYDSNIEKAVEQQIDGKPKSKDRSKKDFSQVTQASLQFYEGFLLAVDSAKHAGVSINLSTFDTKRKKTEVEGLLRKNLPGKTDLIVGSFLIDDLKPLSDFAVENGINLVSPLYNGATNLPPSDNIIKINQSFKKQLEIFIEDFKFQDTCKYIIVYDKENLYSSSIKLFDSLLNLKGKDNRKVVKIYHQTAIAKSADVQDSLMKVLDPNKQNVVIIPSEDEPFVSEFLGHLYGVKSFYNLRTTVYGPARWQKMKNIPSDYFYKLNLHVFTPFYIDYRRGEVKNFIADYRELYREEPTEYSYLGYDIGLYFITALKNYGVNFNDCLHNHSANLLQSGFLFDGLKQGSPFQNKKQFIVKYTSDYDVIREK